VTQIDITLDLLPRETQMEYSEWRCNICCTCSCIAFCVLLYSV